MTEMRKYVIARWNGSTSGAAGRGRPAGGRISRSRGKICIQCDMMPPGPAGKRAGATLPIAVFRSPSSEEPP
ncbi:hypothetical protein AwMethylo_34650 [Methylobacterium sp.]|nr:hypothetical protein AwMethylo_34650 [Methylobacterium sp.]